MDIQCQETYWILNDHRFIPIRKQLDRAMITLISAMIYFMSNKVGEDSYWRTKKIYDSIMNPLKEELGTTDEMEVIKFIFRIKDGKYSDWAGGSDDGFVKIGRSKNPKSRLKDMQSGNAHKLKIIEVFKNRGHCESALHEQFKHLRVRGEWFEYSEEISEFINEKKNDGLSNRKTAQIQLCKTTPGQNN